MVLTRQQVRSVDEWAITKMGIPGVVLMENAGRSCAEYVIARLRKTYKPRVCVFCGTGNNGGDGFVIARHLFNHEINVRVFVFGDPAKIKGDARINYDIISRMNLDISVLTSGNVTPDSIGTCTANCHLIVDALLGTGLTGELKPEFVDIIEAINEQEKPVLAVDIPSGLDCDTGVGLGAVIKAAATITFVAVKRGFTFDSASPFTGEIYVASIGIEPKSA